jgi:hypothetical protein
MFPPDVVELYEQCLKLAPSFRVNVEVHVTGMIEGVPTRVGNLVWRAEHLEVEYGEAIKLWSSVETEAIKRLNPDAPHEKEITARGRAFMKILLRNAYQSLIIISKRS